MFDFDKNVTSSLDKYGWTIWGLGTLVGCSSLPQGGFFIFLGSGAVAGFFFIFGQHYDRKQIEKQHKLNLVKFTKELDECRDVARKFKKKHNFNIEKAINWSYRENNLGTIWVNNGILILTMVDFKYKRYLEENYLEQIKENKKERNEVEKYPHLTIPINSINYFKQIGSISTEIRTTGGGSSLSGAIMGSIIAGDVGAIIGSRKETKIETYKNDERQVELSVVLSDNSIYKIQFDIDILEAFEKLIPEKEYDYVRLEMSHQKNKKTRSSDLQDRLNELSERKNYLKQLQIWKKTTQSN
jgi:hypothetical protein